MQRAKSTVSCRYPNRAGTVTARRAGFFYGLVLVLAGAVAGRPAPEPAAGDDSMIVVGLWQSAASIAALPRSMQLPRAAGYGALSDYPDRPYRRIRLHHFTLPCRSCHVTTPDAAAGTSGELDAPQVAGDINRACTSGGCHFYDPSLNHPLDVEVAEAEGLPSYMPPEHADRINCLTCHSDPRPPTPTADDDTGESTLIVPDGDDLCASCHTHTGNDGKTPGHWRFSNKAHLQSINRRQRSMIQMDISVGRIDTESMTCVSCHDEITVTIPQANETHRQRMARWASMPDHAIGMRYSAIVARRPGQFNYPLADADRIRLFDGRVGCGSCHSLYANNPAYVVTKKNNGTLCRKCHIK